MAASFITYPEIIVPLTPRQQAQVYVLQEKFGLSTFEDTLGFALSLILHDLTAGTDLSEKVETLTPQLAQSAHVALALLDTNERGSDHVRSPTGAE